MKYLGREDWIGLVCEESRVPHSTVAAVCSDPMGPASEAELIHGLLVGQAGTLPPEEM